MQELIRACARCKARQLRVSDFDCQTAPDRWRLCGLGASAHERTGSVNCSAAPFGIFADAHNRPPRSSTTAKISYLDMTGGLTARGQIKTEAGPTQGGIVARANAAAVGFDNGLANCQTQAHTAVFGREEGIEDTGELIRIDTQAAVLDAAAYGLGV